MGVEEGVAGSGHCIGLGGYEACGKLWGPKRRLCGAVEVWKVVEVVKVVVQEGSAPLTSRPLTTTCRR